MRAALTLGLSLALTGALLVMNVVVFRARSGGVVAGPESRAGVSLKRVLRVPPPSVTAPRATNAPPFHWSALESPDYGTYAANLRAIGCPEPTLRDILLPDIEKEYEERKAAFADGREDRFWEPADQRDARQRDREAKERGLDLEKRALIRQLLGVDWNYSALKELRGDSFAAVLTERIFGYTDLAKTEHIFITHQLAEEDVKAFQSATEGIYLDEDLPQLNALRDRFEADLARVLAPTEMEELRLRLAAVDGLNELSRRNGVSLTGAELREVARLRADTHDMLAKTLNLDEQLYSEELRAKGEAAFAELQRRYLGAERFADAERAKDDTFREMFRSTADHAVSKAALVQSYNAWHTAWEQGGQIRNDANLSIGERETLLAALRGQVAQDLARSLGPAALDAYLKQHGYNFTNSLSMPSSRPANGTVITR